MDLIDKAIEDLKQRFGGKVLLNDHDIAPLFGSTAKQISYLRSTGRLPIRTVYLGRIPHCSIYELAYALVQDQQFVTSLSPLKTEQLDVPKETTNKGEQLNAKEVKSDSKRKSKKNVAEDFDEIDKESVEYKLRPINRPSLGPLLAAD